MQRITADMFISDVLARDPRAADVFEQFGLACPSCLAAGIETVRAVATSHDVCVDDLLAELNEGAAQDARGRES